MLRIERLRAGQRVVLALSGRIEDADLAQLDALIKGERRGVILDLKHVTLVGREVVRFLVKWEESGTRIEACPVYIREWVAKERGEN